MAQDFPDGPANGDADAGEAQARASHAKGKDGRKRGFGAWLREVVIIVVIALLLSFLIKTFLFRAFFIPSGSMEETLEIDDRIFVNLLVPEPFDLSRGDVVVFKDTQAWLPAAQEKNGNFIADALTFVGLLPDESEQHLVKRIIGMPGDHVVCCDADGKVTVNGAALDEPYIYPGAQPSDTPFDVVVPEGKVWVMGDHRNASADSREHQDGPNGGFINIEDIEGKASVIAWPLSRAGFIGSYPEVFEDVPDPSGAQTASK
ncbi:signal peptidase I [Arthrobacter gandavensis]|uniref:signal peptidase I n=1 Tax=Arthrobacter gandavensis TaxID=169960 RepID=UPI00188E67BF|nr:signal peptidase I [Arthrobacter gandavensis]MBF4995480.1 signal peptidase I [Arthrobacter gandavensis]